MNAHKREAKCSVYKLVPKIFNLFVILGLALQPVGLAGIHSLALASESESDIENIGSIRVCKIIVDAAGNVVDGSALPGSVFTISGFTPDPATSEGDPVGVLPVSTFATEDLLNARILNSSTGNDARCVTYNDLELGSYYYKEETIPSSDWESPKYNDQFTTSVLAVSDFFLYDGNLFDGGSSDDGSRDTNVDGHIVLNANRPDRTLIVLNQYMLAVVSGFKWNDANSDGKVTCSFDEEDEQEICEDKLSGWTIFLDANKNGTLDNEEASTTTDENGDYSFDSLASGSYRVCEVSQTGWNQTYPANCHTITLPEGQSTCDFQDLPNSVITDQTCNFGNQFIPPTLQIAKTNDSSSPENPGNSVTYTITVTAPEGNTTDVEDVVVMDLPPAGFEFVDGSDTASQGSLTSAYASPGVWSLGTMTPGQTITLSYQVAISGNQDAGNYNDLAFARGTSAVGGDVLAEDPDDTDNFVGTDVEVVLPVAPANVELVNIVERDVDTKTVTKTKRVLGAATILPSTGANVNTILLALLALIGGLILILLGKRSTWNLIRNLSKSMMKVFLFVIVGSLLFAGQSASAASGDLNVQIEQPKAVVNSPEFKVGFVVLDISAEDTIDVSCQISDDGGTTWSVFDTFSNLIKGGTSGDCDVDAADMLADGTYTFKVEATEDTTGDTDTATTDPIQLISGTPSTPLDYSRAEGSCTASFTTANDGLTDKVELYRSVSSTFTAKKPETFVDDVTIAPDTSGTITDSLGNCGDYFYAIRAVALSGLGSGFVGDENVTVDHENKIKTKTDTKKVAGPTTTLGAIPVAGGEAPAGAVEGAATEETGEIVQPSAEQEGSVLGSATEAAGAAAGGIVDWIKSHPWWSLLWFLIIILIAYFARRMYFGNYNENNQ